MWYYLRNTTLQRKKFGKNRQGIYLMSPRSWPSCAYLYETRQYPTPSRCSKIAFVSWEPWVRWALPVRSLNWIYPMTPFYDDGFWVVASRPKKKGIWSEWKQREPHAEHVIRALGSEETKFLPKTGWHQILSSERTQAIIVTGTRVIIGAFNFAGLIIIAIFWARFRIILHALRWASIARCQNGFLRRELHPVVHRQCNNRAHYCDSNDKQDKFFITSGDSASVIQFFPIVLLV